MALPVTVIGGYLGAGKTTLVNHILRNANGLRIAVAVNDFGALPIDRDLIMAEDGDMLTLANGCVCCAFGDDLLGGLAALSAREGIDHVLVEASGVALPGAIARALPLMAGVRREATLVLVDAETIRAQAVDKYMGDTIVRQLADADLVVVNKTDLVAAADLPRLEDWLAMQAPRASIVEARFGAIAPDIALGALSGSDFVCDTPEAPHDTSAISSVSLEIDHPLDVARLCAGLTAPALGLVRAKGFARDRDGAWKTIQIVGRRADVTPAPSRENMRGQIVCIAHGAPLERAAIERAISDAAV